MEMTKHSTNFENILKAWLGEDNPLDLSERLSAVEESCKRQGCADASKGKSPAEDKFFQFLGKLVFPGDEDIDMAEAMAACMKESYMDGYQIGGIV